MVSQMMSRPDPSQQSNLELHPKKWVQPALVALPIFSAALGYAFDNMVLPHLKDWWLNMNRLDPSGIPVRNAIMLATPLALIATTSLATAAYFWLMASRIFRTRTFPPRGYLITAKITILEGRAATKEGCKLLLFGALSIAFAVYAIWSVFAIFPDAIEILRPLYS